MLKQKYLKETIIYDQNTGSFTWNPERPASHFKTAHGQLIFKKRYAGQPVKGSLDHCGQLIIRVGGTNYPAKRLAWLYVHGEWPVGRVRLRDGDQGNLRMINLWQKVAGC